MDFGLEGKLAFVGGASRGIGKAIALELAREGADVVVASRTMPDLEKTAAEIVETTGRRAIPMSFDATNREQVDRVMNAAADALGGLHILVNSASLPGGSPSATGPIEGLVDEDLISDFDVKFVGALRCCRAAIPLLKEQGYGRIVNISGLNARNAGNLSGGARNVLDGASHQDPGDAAGPVRHHRQLHPSRHHAHRAHPRPCWPPAPRSWASRRRRPSGRISPPARPAATTSAAWWTARRLAT